MKLVKLLTLLLCTPLALAQQVVEETPPADSIAKVTAATAAAERGGQGRFRAVMVSDPTLPTHTIYRPENLSAAARSGKLPIVAWGNGACTNIGNRFRYFLTEIASHGYLIIAIGPRGPSTAEWKIDLNANDPRPPAERTAPSFAAQLIDGIDWAIVENSRKGSVYYRRLDTSAIAVMGQSCGGLQAMSAAADRRVKTAVIWNSGTFPDGTRPLSGTGDANKASLNRIHVPIAWISGDDRDIAFKNANEDFEAIREVPALRAWKIGTGHSEVYREPMGGSYTPIGVAWLDWQLKKDKSAAQVFVGTKCTLCNDSTWVTKRKRLE
jgi:dienelactone hydrolase